NRGFSCGRMCAFLRPSHWSAPALVYDWINTKSFRRGKLPRFSNSGFRKKRAGEFAMEGALGSYLSHCRPYEFAAPWDCIIAGPLAYRGPASPETALATLTANYTVEELLASGVAKRGDHCRLTRC